MKLTLYKHEVLVLEPITSGLIIGFMFMYRENTLEIVDLVLLYYIC